MASWGKAQRANAHNEANGILDGCKHKLPARFDTFLTACTAKFFRNEQNTSARDVKGRAGSLKAGIATSRPMGGLLPIAAAHRPRATAREKVRAVRRAASTPAARSPPAVRLAVRPN